MKIHIINLVLLILFNMSAIAQTPVPAGKQKKPVLIMNAVAHLGNGKVFDNAVVAFDSGKFTIVAKAELVRIDPSGYEVIQAGGMHLYPGLIAPSTILGLEEISALRQTRDFKETGVNNANVRAIVAYNAESEIIPTFRFNGVLIAQTVPQGNFIAGNSSIVKLDAWNWEDAVYKIDDGLHVYWPSKPGPTILKDEKKEDDKANEAYNALINEFEKYLQDSKAYAGSDKKTKNLKLEAGVGLFDGSKTLYIHVKRAIDIVTAIEKSKGLGVEKVVLIGADDAYYVKDIIKEHNIPVILSQTQRLPNRMEEGLDMPYKLPGLLVKEGIKVGLSCNSELMKGRNLPFVAGQTVAYGLDKEQALELITKNNAEILGIDDKTGTLEIGKDANLVLCQGDLLDMKENKVVRAFIQGAEIDLQGKQQQLYDRYKNKYDVK